MKKSIKLNSFILIIVILFFCISAFAETITLKSGEKITGKIIEGNKEHIKIIVDGKPTTFSIVEIDSIEDPSEKISPPMFGNSLKTKQQKASDEKFINNVVQEAGSRAAAAKEMVALGWKYYERRDLITSMKRFNQAWLLDPNNADIYWGFGLILAAQGDSVKVIEMYDKSLSINPNNKYIYLNRAHIYEEKGNFGKAIDDYTRAIKIDASEAQFYNDRAVAYFHSEQYDKSWQDVSKAMELGYNIHPGFLEALEEKGYKK